MRICLGTRPSTLALYQAELVKKALQDADDDLDVEIVKISTRGDSDRETPLNQLGQTGVFTKGIDQAIYDQQIDVGVHSLKDYPSNMPPGLKIYAVLPRDGCRDMFVPGKNFKGDLDQSMHILSGSPRRRAQWLTQYPHHTFGELRGNMDTRLNKMHEADGGIVSKQGLERIDLMPEDGITLNWMTPAPAQGVIAVIGAEHDYRMQEVFSRINHLPTFISAHVERSFMAAMEGGCSLPLGALAVVGDDEIEFEGRIDMLDGSDTARVSRTFSREFWNVMGNELAAELKISGGQRIYDSIAEQRPRDVLCAKIIDRDQRDLGLSLGLKIHDLEVLKVENIEFELNPSGPVILSSTNAVKALEDKIDQLNGKAYVVGGKTSHLLRTLGYTGEIIQASDMGELISMIGQEHQSVVYYCAEQTTGIIERSDLAGRLQKIPVYRTLSIQPRMPRLQWDALAFFSPRGIENLTLHNDFDLSVPVVTIGRTTADAAKEAGFKMVSRAAEPSVESVIKKLSTILND